MGPRVGVVGAGQLARMTQQAAIPLGVRLRVLADASDDSAAQVVPDATVGDFRDLATLRAFAAACDVLTFDHELADPAHLETLHTEGHVLRPRPETKRLAQDKLHQRETLSGLGLPVPAYAAVSKPAEVADFAETHGWPVVCKAPRGAYDGHGVWLAGTETEAEALLDRVDGPLLIEEHVPLVGELAVLVARRPSGQAVAYPLVETVQVDGVLRELVVPAPLDAERAEAARDLGLRLAETIQAVGILAVELFDTGQALLVNELACRPHNSGHWSIEGAVTSQFANHLRAVLDWPLGAIDATAPTVVTVNVLGRSDGMDASAGLEQALEVPEVHVHLYGKQPQPGRKLGHVTALGEDAEETRQRAWTAATLLGEGMRGE